MKTKLLSFLVALCATTALWAQNNVITYTATQKLTISTLNVGQTTFGPAITSHTFSNGTGTITCSREITTIGDYAFQSCSSLTSVTIPSSVTTIGDYAFQNCRSLTSVTIGNSVRTIGEHTFEGCSGFTSVTIPNSVTTIGDFAFDGCSGLNLVTIGNSVTTIGGSAFSDCRGLTSVTIGHSVTTIEKYAFSGCSSLTKTNYTGTIADWCKIKFGSSYANPMCYSHNFYINDVEVKDLVIPEGVDTIGERAFYGCDGLTSVTIGNSVTTIGKYAFYGCSGLASVTIGNSVTTIEEYAFSGCSGLTSITIPNSVTTIGNSAFSGCRGFTSVTIGISVTTIEEGAFSGCSGLTSITIPNSVTTIGNSAFWGCSGLTSVTIPNSVTTIGNYIFNGCSGLTSVTIGNSVTTIGDYAFDGCSGLASVIIGNSVTTIGKDAFTSCSSLTSVTLNSNAICSKTYTSSSNIQNIFGSQVQEYIIGDSITTIGSYAFYRCRSLTSVTIGNSVRTIGEGAFGNCYGLTSVTIPNSVRTIGESAFDGCNGLTSVTIGNSISRIGGHAFYGCNNLKKTNYTGTIADWCKIKFDVYRGMKESYANPVSSSHNFYINDVEVKDLVIPDSVNMIEDYAFYGYSSLISITNYATTPPTCGYDCFYNVDKSIPVYVPARSVDTYKQADGWKDFTNLQVNPDDIAVITCNVIGYGTQTGADTYIKGDTCTLTITPDAGYQFTQWNDGDTDNPRSFVVTKDTTFIAQIDTIWSGKCGDNLYWQYNNDTLNITGSGVMYDGQPWVLFRDSITKISLPAELTTIGDSAFANIIQLNSIIIPSNVTIIGANAFSGCRKLYDIYCLAAEPPIAQTSSFDNYNVYLHILCDNLRYYKVDAIFGLFKNIECISAEEKPIEGDQVVITSSADNVTITWPANDDAAEYKLVITKDGVVFCTLKFNAQGQLIGNTFAPSRDGVREMAAAEMTASGWQFTVTGLDQASKYGYTLDILDASQQSIKHYEGEFATDGYTDLEGLTMDNTQGTVRKFIRNNQLQILHNGKMYNALGDRMR